VAVENKRGQLCTRRMKTDVTANDDHPTGIIVDLSLKL